MSVAGKTVLITGASRGIGAEAARVFAAAGANVVLMARSADSLNDLVSEIGDRALAVAGDVSRYEDMDKAVTAGVDAFGSLDILINNAGAVEPISHMASADPADWGHVIDINLRCLLRDARRVARNAPSGWGHRTDNQLGRGPWPG